MKALSVWQPWAALLVKGFKLVETRPMPLPRSAVGERVAIASTKNIRREQRETFADEDFQRCYAPLNLGALDDLHRGQILGSVIFTKSVCMDAEFIASLDPREVAFGIYEFGRYAWLAEAPEELAEPIPARGGQGIWEWHGNMP